VIRQSLAQIAETFLAHVQEVVGEDGGGAYAIIGHSLGNVITRLVSPDLPPGFERFIMLAPPNRPVAMAKLLRNNPVFRLATQDAGQKIGDETFYETLPLPTVPSLIIAGTLGPRASWLPFGDSPNDSVVGLEETRLEGVPVLEVPGVHTFLMNRLDVFQAIRDFLIACDSPKVLALPRETDTLAKID
jgi:hypothetical protein